jgi:hypothetical protein
MTVKPMARVSALRRRYASRSPSTPGGFPRHWFLRVAASDHDLPDVDEEDLDPAYHLVRADVERRRTIPAGAAPHGDSSVLKSGTALRGSRR